jgi:hypothetical protein
MNDSPKLGEKRRPKFPFFSSDVTCKLQQAFAIPSPATSLTIPFQKSSGIGMIGIAPYQAQQPHCYIHMPIPIHKNSNRCSPTTTSFCNESRKAAAVEERRVNDFALNGTAHVQITSRILNPGGFEEGMTMQRGKVGLALFCRGTEIKRTHWCCDAQ